jgi:hypothetical protein
VALFSPGLFWLLYPLRAYSSSVILSFNSGIFAMNIFRISDPIPLSFFRMMLLAIAVVELIPPSSVGARIWNLVDLLSALHLSSKFSIPIVVLIPRLLTKMLSPAM